MDARLASPIRERIPAFAFSVRQVWANDATISCPSCPQPTSVEGMSNVRAMTAAERVRTRLIGIAPKFRAFPRRCSSHLIPSPVLAQTFTLPGIPFDHAYRLLALRTKHVRLASCTKGCAPNAPTVEGSCEVRYPKFDFLFLQPDSLEIGFARYDLTDGEIRTIWVRR